MRLLLIRHGQTPSNASGVLDAQIPGPGLTDLGMKQAAAIPAALAQQPLDAIYATQMTRTRLTGTPLAMDRELPIEIKDGLHEIGAGELEMRGDEAAVRIYLETIFAWAGGESGRAMPGGESGTQFMGRFDASIAEIAATGAENVAVFSHGAAIRIWAAARSDDITAEFAAHNGLENTGAVILDGSPDQGWACRQWLSDPIGGSALADHGPADPTGEGEPESV